MLDPRGVILVRASQKTEAEVHDKNAAKDKKHRLVRDGLHKAVQDFRNGLGGDL